MCGTSQVMGASGGVVQQTAVMGATGGVVQQSAVQGASGHAHGANGGGDHHGAMPKVPPKDSPIIQKLLADGSYGPTVKEGKAKTIKIPDGEGFGGIKGRKQNGDDKKQNNYSVTDANFFPTMGVLNDAKTGKPLNYVKQIQAYNAAGYISTFHPDVYAKMVQVQDAGQGTILGMALNLMGVDGAQVDPGLAAGGLQSGMFANENVPGSPLNAKSVVMSGKDLAGEEWARPHHAESAWPVYKKLVDAGLDYKSAMIFSGDDAVSGSGRMNGFNNQDGKDGFNADEAAVYRMAAVVQQRTGIPVVDIMAGGHSHTGIDKSAMTNPNINKLIGLPKGDRSSSPERLAKIRQALLDGTISDGTKQAKKFDVNAKGAFKGAGGTPEVLQYAITQVAGAKGGGTKDKIKQDADAGGKGKADGGGAVGGGAGAPDVAVGGGCNMDPQQGVGLLGGGGVDMGSIAAILQQLQQALAALAAAISSSGVAGASGGGPTQKEQQPVLQGGGATTQHSGHAH